MVPCYNNIEMDTHTTRGRTQRDLGNGKRVHPIISNCTASWLATEIALTVYKSSHSGLHEMECSVVSLAIHSERFRLW